MPLALNDDPALKAIIMNALEGRPSVQPTSPPEQADDPTAPARPPRPAGRPTEKRSARPREALKGGGDPDGPHQPSDPLLAAVMKRIGR